MRKKDLEVVERRARACLVHVATKSFVAGAHTVPVSRKGDKDKEATGWKFSNDEKKGNPFMVRAPVNGDYELYIELSIVVRKKGTTTTGQQAMSSGDIKEFSAGFGCLRLNADVKKGAVNLPLFGGTPWGRVQVQEKDLEGQKKSGGLFGRFKGAQVSQVSIKVDTMKDKELAELGPLPSALVCHPWIKEGLAEFCKLQHDVNSRTELFTRPDVNDMVLSTFPTIMDSYDVMRSFVVRYNAANKKEKAAAFRECVSLYYPIVHMDTSRMPKYLDLEGSPEKKAREEVLEKFDKNAKTKEKLVEQLLNSDAFRGVPFRIDELAVH